MSIWSSIERFSKTWKDKHRHLPKRKMKPGAGSLTARDLRIEQFEQRMLLAIGPELVAVIHNARDILLEDEVLDVAPREFLIRFSEGQTIDSSTLDGIQIVRSGGDDAFDDDVVPGVVPDVTVEFGWAGIGDRPNEVIVRFAETLPDDIYRINIIGTDDPLKDPLVLPNPLANIGGDPFGDDDGDGVGSDETLPFELDLGAQVIAVVPQPITRDLAGNLQQARNQIVVYFNNDDLDPVSAEDPNFYQLFDTNDTATTTDDTLIDLVDIGPYGVAYDSDTDTAVLTYIDDLDTYGTGPFRLRIGDEYREIETPTLPPSVVDAGPLATADNGSLQPFAGSDIADGETFTLSDGARTVVFEFEDTTLPASVLPGHVAVEFTPLDTAATVATAIEDAINGVPSLPNGAPRLIMSATQGTGVVPADVPGIIVTPTSGLMTTESGGQAQFSVTLKSRPDDDVTIGLSSTDTTEGTVAVTDLVFTRDNWNQTQIVTVTGVDDGVADGAVSYSILTDAADSSDGDYSGLFANAVAIDNMDNEGSPSGVARLFAVPDDASDDIVELDPLTGVEVNRFGAPASTAAAATGLAYDGTSLFFVDGSGASLWRLDPDTGATQHTAPLALPVGTYDGLAALGGDIYILDSTRDDILVVDPVSGAVIDTWDVDGDNPSVTDLEGGLSAITGPDALIVMDDGGNTVLEFNPTTGGIDNSFSTFSVGGAKDYMGAAVVNGEIYAANHTSTPKIDVYSRAGDHQRTMPMPGGISALGGDDVPTGPPSVGPVFSDPAGDTFGSHAHDIASVQGFVGSTDVTLRMDFFTPITAPSSGEANGVIGWWDLDVDQDDLTGVASRQSTDSPPGQRGGLLGVDIVVDLGYETTDPGSVNLLETTGYTPIDQVPITYGPDYFEIVIPLTLLGTDGILNFGTVIGGISGGASDAAPNAVFGTTVAHGITVTPSAGLETTESGASALFTLALDTPPSDDVFIGLDVSDTAEGSLSTTGLTFTPTNWNVPQTVTVTGVDDVDSPVVDGLTAYTVVTAAAVSMDSDYSGIDATDVSLTNLDNDIAGGLRVDLSLPSSDAGTSFDTAQGLGEFGLGSDPQAMTLSAAIEPQGWVLLPLYPGGSDEPGHRDIPHEDHGAGAGAFASAPGSIGVTAYSFPSTYGSDLQGNTLYNQINEDQKDRAREIFEMYASLFGFEVRETASSGIRVVTGDVRVLLPPGTPPGGVGGISGGGMVIMNAMNYGDPAADAFGAGWMGVALHEIGHSIGLGHAYDIRSQMGGPLGPEDAYPGQADVIHGQRIQRPDAIDIDMYQFTVADVGVFTAETIAERLAAPKDASLLNTALRLYRQEIDGSRTLISQNDDYFSNDSYIELELKPGTYFVGVSSTGNTDYDPTIEDSGFGGLTDGIYDLKLGFEPTSNSNLLDATGTAFDGDNDGDPGGAHEFFFRSANTLVVDKTTITNLTQSLPASAAATTVRVVDVDVIDATPGITVIKIDAEEMLVTAVNPGAKTFAVDRGHNGTPISSHSLDAPVRLAAEDGSLAAPYGVISTALAVALPGEIIRIVGNGGEDGDIISTPEDNLPYLIGLDEFGVPLEDGWQFQIPNEVVVQIDAGAILKLRSAVIDAGTSDQLLDRSGGTLQVLGTPDLPVFFTSYGDDTIGGDSNGPASVALSGDWGGLVFRPDSDFQDPSAGPYDPAIVLNYVNQAKISFGGGSVDVDSITSTYSPIHIDTTRPTVTNNLITVSANAAMSANPDAFDDSRGRIGPEIHGNIVVGNTFNGIFVRIATEVANQIDRLNVAARFNDTDIVHVITESLEIVGNAGGPIDNNEVQQLAITGTPTSGKFTLTFIDGAISSLAAPITASATTLLVGSTRNFPATPFDIQVGSEIMTVNGATLTTFSSVVRGARGTAAVGHVLGTGITEAHTTTGLLLPDATIYDVRAELFGLLNVGVDNVSVTGGPLPGSPVQIEFIGDLRAGNQPQLFVHDMVAGAAPAVTTIENGGQRIVARPSGRLKVDPGIVVKLSSSRIEGLRGNSHLIAEGTEDNLVIFTSLHDDRFGMGGTFDTSNNLATPSPAKGDWGGLIFNANSRGSIDRALIAYGGGETPIAGNPGANFSTIEVHHNAHVRLANSTLTDNDDLATGGNRDDRGGNDASLIFVRQAQPIIVNNVFENNDGNVISINANAMLHTFQRDTGRSTGALEAFDQFSDNHGPLVRLNQMTNNGTNGMNVRAEMLTNESVWDDTDIVHVLRGEISIDQHHAYSGLRLQSAVDASLVVKLWGANAGFTADGIPLDIDDRIGGAVQIVGQPGSPVVLTSLADDSVGASFDPDGFAQTDTNNNGASMGAPGDWRGLLFEKYSNDRNVRVVLEPELANNDGIDVNNTPFLASFIGQLAPDQKSGDENRVLGFEIHGHISGDDSGDVDVYSFKAPTGTEVWLDIDRTRGALDTVIELVQSNGTVLASSTRSDISPGDGRDVLTGSADPLARDAYNGGDYYTLNHHDAGFRVVLPGPAGQTGTFFVRVRSNGGLTSGEYQLQVRLQQRDEKPGSTVRFADIRYPVVGIDVRGLPSHSPLLGESDETTANNTSSGGAQNLGNLLESDRNTINFSGELTNSSDIDFYRFNADYAFTELGPSIQVIGGMSDGGKTWATVFDLDYSDGLTRGDTTMLVFDSSGTPILVGRESNVTDDQPAPGQGNDLDELTRGSAGKLDPFIGTVQLPIGTPSPSSGTEYYVAVSANGRLITDLNQYYQASAANANIRLEPINSVDRIVEDHIGFQGYHSGGLTGPPSQPGVLIPAVNTNANGGGLFNSLSSEQALSTYVRPFDLSDVLLYVNTADSLRAVNPLFGQQMYTIDNNLTANNEEMRDIVMRSDGQLYGYQRLDTNTAGNANMAGRLVTINHATGALTTVGTDNIQGETAPYLNGNPWDMDDLTITDDVGAVTFRRNSVTSTPFREGYYSVFENGADADGSRNSKLYRFNVDTGVILNSTTDRGGDNIQLSNVDYATATVSLTNTTGTTNIQVQAHAPGTAGNGISVNLNRVTTGSGARVTSASSSTINVEVDDGATAQQVVDAINGDDDAKRFVQAARTSNNNYTAATSVSSDTTSGGGGSGTPLKGNVTGLAFDQFTGGTLYGITDRGEFISINRNSGAATMVYDFGADPQGLGVGTDFQGLSLGPQNVHGGLFANTFFAITGGGDLVAFRPSGGSIVPVDAFGSDNEQQLLVNSGSPAGIFTLTFTSDRFGQFTTASLPGDASAAQVQSALEALSTPEGVPIISPGDVIVTGTDVVAGLTVEFTGFFQDKDVAQLTANDSGGTAVSSFNVAQGGDGIRDTHVVSTGVGGATGLAFSPVDVNLWHPTTRRGNDEGHGINWAYDYSRTPSVEEHTLSDGSGGSNDDVYDHTEEQGGASFYFGLEEYANSDDTAYLNYEASRTQLGILDNEFQRDLTSTGTIGNNYDLPGGAFGSLITDPFDLVSNTGSSDATDRPTLYFNYWLDTEGASNGDSAEGEMKDSARVYISSDGGRTWKLLTTNNSPRSVLPPFTELPSFASHSRYADRGDGRQRIQELFETDNWRQARVDLSDFVGRTDLVLRFDFSTAGTIIDPDLITRHTDLDTPQDSFGDHQGDGATGDFQRAQNNAQEGFYIDDIIVGWSERGEMITAANSGATGYFAVPTDPDPFAVVVIEDGLYQVEVRRGEEHAANVDKINPEIIIGSTFDPNDRLIPSEYRLGDSNIERAQGAFHIENNYVRDAENVGILVQAGSRESTSGIENDGPSSLNPTPGSPINFDTENPERFATGVVIQNNVVVGFGNTGIQFGAESNTAGSVPAAAVPVGKIINNTLYGSENRTGTAIRVTNGAAPIVLNNIVANASMGINVGGASPLRVIGRNFFHDNAQNGTTGEEPIVDSPLNPLFVDVSTGNFYLASGAEAIDRSLGSLPDLPEFVSVKTPLEIPNSDAFSPDEDLFGQPRVDDPSQDPSGLGDEVFNDLGAIERGDTSQPFATVLLPLDGGLVDIDLDLNEVLVLDEPMPKFVIQLSDIGVGIDNVSVLGSRVHIWRDLDESTFDYADFLSLGTPEALIENADYLFRYDEARNRIILIPTAGYWPVGSTYTIVLEDAIQDLAGNPLLPTGFPDPLSGLTVFEVTLAAWDYGDAPDTPLNSYPSQLESQGARHITNEPLYLGAGVNAENDSLFNADATGDLFDDGVVFDSDLLIDSAAKAPTGVTVNASDDGILNAWIDFNGDGIWAPGEQVFTDVALTQGDNYLLVNVPDATVVGLGGAVDKITFGRFRFSSQAGLAPTGFAFDGEVEDYQLRLVTSLPPTAEAGGPYVGFEGSNIELNANGSTDPDGLAPFGDIVSYEWDLDNDGVYEIVNAAPLTTVTFNRTDDDFYTVGLRVTDAIGGVDTDTATVTVINVTPTADAGGNRTVNEGTDLTLDASGSTDPGLDIASYEWDLDYDGVPANFNVDATGVNATFNRTDDTDIPPVLPYVVALRVTDDDGAFDIVTIDVTVENVAPVADAGGLYSGDEGSDIPLTAAASDDLGDDIFSYEWDLDNDGVYEIVNPASDPTATFNSTFDTDGLPATGPYIVGLRVTDDDGAFATTTTTVTVSNVRPTAVIGGPYVDDEGSTITLDGQQGSFDPGEDIVTYEWDLDYDGITFDIDWTGPTTDVTRLDDDVFPIGLKVTDHRLSVSDIVETTVEFVNVAPAVLPGADQTAIPEGDTVTIAPTFTDVGVNDTHTATIDWGDGTALVAIPNANNPWTAPDTEHVYDNNGTYTVTITVTDDDAGETSETLTVTVVNVAPVVVPGADQTAIPEGDPVSIAPTFTDAGVLDTHTATIDWGDGTIDPVIDPATSPLAGTHVYADNGNYTVTVTVTDNDGDVGTDTLTVSVDNVAPSLNVIGGVQQINEGTFITLGPATFSDPGFDNPAAPTEENFTATVTWGDGNIEPVVGITLVEIPGSEGILTTGTIDATHAYADNGTYTVTVTVTDDDGLVASDSTLIFEVGNVVPFVFAGADQTVNEGDTVSIAPVFTDAGSADWHTATISWGDLTPDEDFNPATSPMAGTHVYVDNGFYTVTVTVTDDDGGVNSDTLDVTVNNVAPLVVAGPNQTVDEGDTVTIAPTFSDVGLVDTHTATINWGDGTIDPVINPATSPLTTTPTHVFAADGVYIVTITVTDDDGGVGTGVLIVTARNVVPTADAGGPYAIDVGSGVTLDGSASSDPGNDIVLYQWDLDDDPEDIDPYDDTVEETQFVSWSFLVSLGVNIPVDMDPQSTSFGLPVNIIGLRVTDGNGATDTDSAALRIYDNRPFARFTDPTPAAVPYGQTVAFDASTSWHGHPDHLGVPGHAITSYEWDFDYDGATFDVDAAGVTTDHAYPMFGQYTVALRVTDDNIPAKIDIATVIVDVSEGNQAPVADIAGAPYVIEMGGSLAIDGTASSDPDAIAGSGDSIVSYEWDLDNDGQFDNASGDLRTIGWSTLVGLGLDYPADPVSGLPTNFIGLRVTDSFGLTDTAITTVTIYDNSIFPVLTAAPNPVAYGQTVAFDASGSTHGHPDYAIGTYEWDFDYDGTFDADPTATTATPTHAYPMFGQYTVAVRLTDDNALAPKTAMTTVLVDVSLGNQAPVADANGPYAIDFGDDLQLDGSASSDPDAGAGDIIVSYEWDLDGDGVFFNTVTATGANELVPAVRLLGLAAGELLPVRLRVTDSFGLFHVATTGLTITRDYPPTADPNGPYTVDEGSQLRLDGTGSRDHEGEDAGIDLYEWDLDYDVFNQLNQTFDVDLTGQQPAITFDEDFAPRVIALRVTDTNGLTDIQPSALEVINVAPTVQVLSAPATVTEGSELTLTSSVVDPGPQDSHTYQWAVAKNGIPYPVGIADTDELTFTLDDNGTYRVTLTVTDDEGGVGTDTVFIGGQNVAPMITTFETNRTVVELGEELLVTGTFTDAGELDTHTVDINWGDVITLATVDPISRTFTATHTYTTAIDVVSVGATLTDNDGGGTGASAPIAVADVMGPVAFSNEITGLDTSVRDFWFSVETANPGWLTLEAVFNAAGGAVDLTLYDVQRNPLATSSLIDGNQRIDHDAPAGEKFYVKLNGTSTNVGLVVTNLVDHTNSTVTVYGTDEDDTFEFASTGSYQVTINGVAYYFDDAEVGTVNFDGGDGNDVASLDDSSGNDSYTATPDYSLLVAPGFTVRVESCSEVHSYARNGGVDTAIFIDSPEDDKVKAEDGNVVKMYNSSRSFYNRVKFFEAVQVNFSEGGTKDDARLWDSPVPDIFDGMPGNGRYYSQDTAFDVTVLGADFMTVYSTNGGTDRLILHDSPGDDVFRGKAHKVEMFDRATGGEVYKITARQFKDVTALADQGGADIAKLYDSTLDDLWEAEYRQGETWSKITSTNSDLYEVLAFEQVKGYSVYGGTNTLRKKIVSPEVDFVLTYGDWEDGS